MTELWPQMWLHARWKEGCIALNGCQQCSWRARHPATTTRATTKKFFCSRQSGQCRTSTPEHPVLGSARAQLDLSVAAQRVAALAQPLVAREVKFAAWGQHDGGADRACGGEGLSNPISSNPSVGCFVAALRAVVASGFGCRGCRQQRAVQPSRSTPVGNRSTVELLQTSRVAACQVGLTSAAGGYVVVAGGGVVPLPTLHVAWHGDRLCLCDSPMRTRLKCPYKAQPSKSCHPLMSCSCWQCAPLHQQNVPGVRGATLSCRLWSAASQ